MELCTSDRILAAANRLKGKAHITPIATSSTLNEYLGAEIFFKCENLQKIGAFKYRGAYNAISQLTPTQRDRGIITFSSGNHAQAVARVGRDLGIKTTIVMPTNAPAAKRQATADYGGNIVPYNPSQTTRESVTEQLLQENNYTFIPPFNHPDVIAGQGTAALELMSEIDDLDTILVPCGGGGLLSGSAIAAKHLHPHCQVIGIEPAQADDATRSFRSGNLVTIENPQTIADGTRTPSLGTLTFPLIQQYVDDMQTVSELAICQAVSFLFYRMKLVVEPSGALGLAALLTGVVRAKGRVGVILSGGNVDAQTMSDILRNAGMAG